jgi:flagellar biosynthesis/type III secretory pathway protein FliH
LIRKDQALAEARKYAFETVFEASGAIVTQAATRRFAQTDLDAARAEGLAAGRSDAQAKADMVLAGQLQALAEAIGETREALRAHAGELRAEAARLALQLARKVADAALSQFGEARALAALDAALEGLANHPRIIVRLNPHSAHALSAPIEDLAERHGLKGALIVRPDPEAGMGDIRIEWGDGAMAINAQEAFSRLEAALNDALSDAVCDDGPAREGAHSP